VIKKRGNHWWVVVYAGRVTPPAAERNGSSRRLTTRAEPFITRAAALRGTDRHAGDDRIVTCAGQRLRLVASTA